MAKEVKFRDEARKKISKGVKTLAKAVTWNGFYLKKEKGVWTAQVVCDT